MFGYKSQNHYYPTGITESCIPFTNQLNHLLVQNHYEQREVIFLCIGSDRATGDSLGPLLGYKLSLYHLKNVSIYGTLDSPVHAQNIKETLELIHTIHPDGLIIAIDASLGTSHHIGYVTLANHSLLPGSGVNKSLPRAGDISITGIVNIKGRTGNQLLLTTRLQLVMKMTDYLLTGILASNLANDNNYVFPV